MTMRHDARAMCRLGPSRCASKWRRYRLLIDAAAAASPVPRARCARRLSLVCVSTPSSIVHRRFRSRARQRRAIGDTARGDPRDSADVSLPRAQCEAIALRTTCYRARSHSANKESVGKSNVAGVFAGSLLGGGTARRYLLLRDGIHSRPA